MPTYEKSCILKYKNSCAVYLEPVGLLNKKPFKGPVTTEYPWNCYRSSASPHDILKYNVLFVGPFF